MRNEKLNPINHIKSNFVKKNYTIQSEADDNIQPALNFCFVGYFSTAAVK